MKRLQDYFQLLPGFIAADEGQQYFDTLLAETPWQQPNIRVFGKTYPLPRQTAWFADNGLNYRYSGIQHQPLAWTPCLSQIRAQAECRFNSVLLNLYRHGQDSNGWHADDEPELNPRVAIASLSLGASRRFRLRFTGKSPLTTGFDLQHGDLLLMRPFAQSVTQHCLPKTRRQVGLRINLTFRQIIV